MEEEAELKAEVETEKDGRVTIHNKNTMFKWYLTNVKLSKRGPNATYLPTKQSRFRKIDGFAALLDAHTEYLRRLPAELSPDRDLVTVLDVSDVKRRWRWR